MIRKRFGWQLFFGLALILLSAAVYLIHYLIFRDLHHIFIYLIGDIAFVFIEVLLVTMIIHRLLVYQQKQEIMKKLNMIIGAFFSEVGTELIRKVAAFDKEIVKVNKRLKNFDNWSDNDFARAQRYFARYKADIDIKKGDLAELALFLKEKRDFLLNLLENPNILEHDSFTDLLWAVFHLTEELCYRINLDNLPQEDYRHLALDIKRSYKRLIVVWVNYIQHLKQDYPYLFSLTVRVNPFLKHINVEVKQ
jgi:hypothetical protein